MRMAVCDDMQYFLQEIRSVLDDWTRYPSGLQVEMFDNGDSLITAHNANPFDIILLDVIMPLLNGIETAREIRQLDKNVKIVFLTSSPEFAVDSYTVKADNYLLKPLIPEKLYACLEELTEELHSRPKTIVIKSARALHQIEIKDIEYLEAQNKHVMFAFRDGTTITAVEPLYKYEDMLLLSDGFFKVSRSYIVNIHHIHTYSTKELRMHTGCLISISRSFQKEFETAYFETLFGRIGDL